MITKQAAMEAVRKYGRNKAAKVLKISVWKVRSLIGATGHSSCKNTGDGPVVRSEKTVRVARRRNLISEDALLQSTDAETRITTALKDELKRLGVGQYMKDQDMRRECHASDLMLWRDIREQEEFWNYAMVVGRTSDPMVYWGNPESIKSLIGRGKAKAPAWRMV